MNRDYVAEDSNLKVSLNYGQFEAYTQRNGGFVLYINCHNLVITYPMVDTIWKYNQGITYMNLDSLMFIKRIKGQVHPSPKFIL